MHSNLAKRKLPAISVVILKIEVDRRGSNQRQCQWLDLCTQRVARLD